jgi:hypothetical protein
VTRDEATEVGRTAADAGRQVAGTAAEQAANVAQEVKTQARDLVGEARGQVQDQARAGQQKAADGIRALSQELREMADGGQQSGTVSEVARQAADRADRLADWLGRREPGDLVEEVRSFARRRPARSCSARRSPAVVVGRLTRGAVDSARADSGRAPQHLAGAPTYRTPAVPPSPYPAGLDVPTGPRAARHPDAAAGQAVPPHVPAGSRRAVPVRPGGPRSTGPPAPSGVRRRPRASRREPGTQRRPADATRSTTRTGPAAGTSGDRSAAPAERGAAAGSTGGPVPTGPVPGRCRDPGPSARRWIPCRGAPMSGRRPPPHPAGSYADVGEVSVGELFGNVTRDLSTLMRQELALAQAEVKAEVSKTGKAAGALGAAGFAGYMAVLFLSICLWWALGHLIGNGWSALVVAVLWGIVGAVLYSSGRKKLRRSTPPPSARSTR